MGGTKCAGYAATFGNTAASNRIMTTLAIFTTAGIVPLLIHVVIVALIFWLLYFLVNRLPIPEPFKTVLNVILLVAAVIFLINVLLGLEGHAFL